MTEPFLGEIKIVPYSFAPKGWAYCDGAVLQIAQNQALFSLIGTAFGGDGIRTFGLPDLRGRAMAGWGSPSFPAVGMVGGEPTHTLSVAELPTHTHLVAGTSAAGTTPLPQGNVFANPGRNGYAMPNPAQPVAPGTVSAVGGSQPHENMAPYLVLSFVIALVGIFPSRP